MMLRRTSRSSGAAVLGTFLACAMIAGPALATRQPTRGPHRPSLTIGLARAGAVLPHHRRLSARGTHTSQPRAGTAIVGGSDAYQGSFGYLAYIDYTYPGTTAGFICTGTIVSKNAVLTAGHCATDESSGAPVDPAGYTVTLGSIDWTDPSSETHTVMNVVVDPAYDPSLKTSDAALLILSKSTALPTIRLATSADQALEAGGTEVTIAGWGETYLNSGASNILQTAQSVVQDASYCNAFSDTYDPSVELCAVDYPNDDTATCHGDSGGPLIASDANSQDVEIGVDSYGVSGASVPDCNTYTADYFTAVAPLESWANGVIRSAAPKPTLPTMTKAQAKSFNNQTLGGLLGRTYNRGHQRHSTCMPKTNARFTCNTNWWYGPNDYAATVGVWYSRGSGTDVYWNDHYSLEWVNDQCYNHSRHRNRCAIHHQTGVY